MSERHGYNSRRPDGGPDNRMLLERELGDLNYAIAMMVHADDVNEHWIAHNARNKASRIALYLHHQERLP